MKTHAAILTEVGKIKHCEVELPTLKSDEILVEVHATGLCGSDMSVYLGQHVYKKPPIVLGHEFMGRVTEIGPAVLALRRGDHVCASSYSHCGVCNSCSEGSSHLCVRKRNISHDGWNGSFARHVVLKENMVHLLPHDISPEIGALVEPMTIGLHAMRLAGDLIEREVVILGTGSIGLACLASAKALGASTVMCVDRGPLKRDIAFRMGADGYVDSDVSDITTATLTKMNSESDVVVVACSYHGSLADALRIVKPGGTVIVVAYIEQEDRPLMNDYLRKEVTIRFSYLSMVADFKTIVDWIVAGVVDPSPMITHRFPLSYASQGCALKHSQPRNVGKVMFHFQNE